MAKKTEKTNAARLLDKAGVKYKMFPYEFETVFVSAGVRGLQFESAPEDLIAFVQGKVAEVAAEM